MKFYAKYAAINWQTFKNKNNFFCSLSVDFFVPTEA